MSKAPKKLYLVTIEVAAVVAATDEAEAKIAAADDAREIVSNAISAPGSVAVQVVEQITRAAQLPAGWNDMCLPHGFATKPIHLYLNAQEQ